jgi:single-strand DNA-binding protein
MYLNKATIIGNLVRDPELRSLPNGTKVVNFSLATNRYWKDQGGQRQESTEYHNAVAFGRQAENIAAYMKKGSSMLIEGRLQTRSWEQDGQKKYRTEIIVENSQFGSRGAGGDATGGGSSKAPTEQPQPSSEAIDYPEEDINPDDIPF